MSGFISKGIKLSYKATTSASSYTDLTNLPEIPELGGDVDSIEITTLGDGAHVYMNGLKNYGDNLSFKFLYEPNQFSTLQNLTGSHSWKVSLPDGTAGAIDTTCTFDGESSVKLDGVGTNAPLTYTLNIKPSTDMTWA